MGIMNPMEYKCVHRHSGIEHPSCYQKHICSIDGLSVGYLDIETSNLSADFGLIYSWAIKRRGESPVYYGNISKKDFKSFPYDRQVTQSLINAMQEFDVLYTYYGSRFDIPFIRTRALMNNLKFPLYKQIIHQDLYFAARSKLKLHSNRLASACEALGISGKTPIKNEYWLRATTGDMEAIDYIVKHNIADVAILEEFHNKIKPYIALTKRSI